jgi:hypothetical protein
MPLNLEARSSEDFIAYLKFNGKAGRWYTRADTGEDREILQLTAIFDLANIKTGWILFAEGQAPDISWDSNGKIPEPPSPKHKRGFAVNVFSPKLIGGLREFSSTSNGAIIAIKQLYDTYEKQYDSAKRLVPVVTCESVEAVKSKYGTNYQPVFKITKWVPRPQDMPTPSALAGTVTNGAAGARAGFDADDDEDIPLPPPSSARPAEEYGVERQQQRARELQQQAAVDEF